MSQNGCVVFAKNVRPMSDFYQAVLSMTVSEAAESHEVLNNDALELVIHAIPKKIADSIVIEDPPLLRANVAMKPAYLVGSLDAVRRACEGTGGGLNPTNTLWTIRGLQVLDGWDPEGNVIQFKQANSSL